VPHICLKSAQIWGTRRKQQITRHAQDDTSKNSFSAACYSFSAQPKKAATARNSVVRP